MSLSKWGTSATALALLFFVGCTDTATEPVANTDQAADASIADSGEVAGEPADSDDHGHTNHDHEGDTAADATDDAQASDTLPYRTACHQEQTRHTSRFLNRRKPATGWGC